MDNTPISPVHPTLKTHQNTINLWQIISAVLLIALIITGVQYFEKTKTLPIVGKQFSAQSSSAKTPIDAVKKLIEDEYKGSNPSDAQIQDGLAKGYVSALGDKYSMFLNKAENEALFSSIDEKYVGIGIVFEAKEDRIAITKVFDTSPAKDVGLVVGDAITAVGDKKVSEYVPTDTATKDIKGPEGSSVVLTVLKADSSVVKLTVQRRQIQLPLTELTWVNNYQTAVIRVNSFGSTLDAEFAQDIKSINTEPRAKHVVIDLRDNGGGYLQSAVDIVSHFVRPNQLVTKEESRKTAVEHKTSTKLDTAYDLPIAILVNKNTASASEITALALKELKSATVVGEKTYGKGVVQSVFSGNDIFKDGQSLKLTTAEWLGPNGTKINLVGITPDVLIAEKDDALKIMTDSFDWQTKTLKK